MSQPFSRRHVLLVAGSAILASVPILSRSFAAKSKDLPAPEELLATLTVRGDARLIGARWLRGEPEPPTPTMLIDTLSRRLREHGWRPGAGTGTLRSALAASIRSEFARGDMVSVGGWQLARTTVELCGLAATT